MAVVSSNIVYREFCLNIIFIRNWECGADRGKRKKQRELETGRQWEREENMAQKLAKNKGVQYKISTDEI